MPAAQKIVDSGDVSASTISDDGTLVAYTRSADYSTFPSRSSISTAPVTRC